MAAAVRHARKIAAVLASNCSPSSIVLSCRLRARGCLRGDRYWRTKIFLDFHRLGIHTQFAACVDSPNAARNPSNALAS